MKAIVTTTVSGITEATRRFSEMAGWTLIVVGDLKTPDEYRKLNLIYLSPKDQEQWKGLSDLIGWNCIERKMFGIISALELGADPIAIVDDDNIPMDNWGNIILGEREINCVNNFMCIDPYFYTNNPHLWHRGFPAREVKNRGINDVIEKKTVRIDVQSGLCNKEPDIDAVCRIKYNPIVEWKSDLFPITTDSFSPFNSQNTIFTREAIKEYFMMCGTGRMTDIWASYYLESKGFHVAYTEADVIHDRHLHNITQDLKDEIRGEETPDLLTALRKNPRLIKNFIPVRTWAAFKEYKRIVDEI